MPRIYKGVSQISIVRITWWSYSGISCIWKICKLSNKGVWIVWNQDYDHRILLGWILNQIFLFSQQNWNCVGRFGELHCIICTWHLWYSIKRVFWNDWPGIYIYHCWGEELLDMNLLVLGGFLFSKLVYKLKLDGVGPVDNRPSTN